MVRSVSTNTYNYLQAATVNGLMVRYLVWIAAKNRSTGAIENIGVSNDGVARTFSVVRPSDGATVNRVYQPAAGLMELPEIPETMSLEVATLTLRFARLTPAMLDAVKVYNPRRQSIQIHMALFDRNTGKMVDPAICIWDGIINRTPIKRDKVGGSSSIEIVTANHAVMLTRTEATKMSAGFFEARGDQAGRHIATIWKVRIPWGQDAIKHGDKERPKEKFFR